MQPINEMNLEFSSKSRNESFARVVAAAFVSQLRSYIRRIGRC